MSGLSVRGAVRSSDIWRKLRKNASPLLLHVTRSHLRWYQIRMPSEQLPLEVDPEPGSETTYLIWPGMDGWMILFKVHYAKQMYCVDFSSSLTLSTMLLLKQQVVKLPIYCRYPM